MKEKNRPEIIKVVEHEDINSSPLNGLSKKEDSESSTTSETFKETLPETTEEYDKSDDEKLMELMGRVKYRLPSGVRKHIRELKSDEGDKVAYRWAKPYIDAKITIWKKREAKKLLKDSLSTLNDLTDPVDEAVEAIKIIRLLESCGYISKDEKFSNISEIYEDNVDLDEYILEKWSLIQDEVERLSPDHR